MSLKKKFVFILALPLAVLVISFVFSVHVGADDPYSDTGEYYPGNLNNSVADVSQSGGNAITPLPDSWFDVTDIDSGQPLTLNLRYSCSTAAAGLGLSVSFNNPTETSSFLNKNYNPLPSCQGANGVIPISFSIPASDTENSVGLGLLYSTHVEVIASAASGHRPFSLSVQGGSGLPEISYVGDGLPGVKPTDNGESFLSRDHEYGIWIDGTADFQFQAPCDWNDGSEIYLKWQGVDNGASYQQGDATWVLKDERTGQEWTEHGSQLGDYKDEAPKYSSGIPLDHGDTYDWTWSNMGTPAGANAIGLVVPFSANSLFSGESCTNPNNWTLSGASHLNGPSVLGPDQSTSMYHVVTNNGPANATYDWRVVWSNNPNQQDSQWAATNISGSVSGSGGSDPPGTNSAQIASLNSYSFPQGTQPGTEYCQKIRFTNATGDNTNYGYSPTPACVTFEVAGGPSSSITPSCSDAYFDVGSGPSASYKTVRWALYESPVGSLPNAWHSGQDITSSKGYADAFLDYNSLTSSSGTATDSVENYALNGGQIRSGSVSWYLVTWDHLPPSGSGKKTTYTTHVNQVDQVSTGPCFEATCSINVSGSPQGWAPTDMESGQQFQASVTITNTGSNTLNSTLIPSDPAPLSGTWTWPGYGWRENNIGTSIPPGGSATSPIFNLYAGNPGVNTVAQYTLSAYPDYWGRGSMPITSPPGSAATCSRQINVFAYFNFSPSTANVTLNNAEDPTSATKTFYIDNTGYPYYDNSYPVGTNVSENLYYDRAGTPQYSGVPVETGAWSGTYGSNTYTHVYPVPPGWNAGDQYCVQMNINPASGWTGPGGAGYGQAPGTFNGNCPSIHNDPYFKVYNSGILSGGEFQNNFASPGSQTTCVGGGALASWNNDSGTYPDSGAGSQFSALALNSIYGFASAQPDNNSNATQRNWDDLTFANKGVSESTIGSTTQSPLIGGDLANPSSHLNCLPSPPLNSATTTTEPAGNATISNLASMAGAYKYNGNVTINAGPSGVVLPNGNDLTLFVKGNVYINGNITYNQSGWSLNVTQHGINTNIPSFELIVSGNIYIDPGVTNLDGLYTAEYSTAGDSNGRIYTCAYSNGPVTYSTTNGPNDFYSICNKQLTVSGAFVADKVDLQRTYGSLRDSVSDPNETPNQVNGAYAPLRTNCSNNAQNGSSPTCAAEVFDFGPDMYISNFDAQTSCVSVPCSATYSGEPPIL